MVEGVVGTVVSGVVEGIVGTVVSGVVVDSGVVEGVLGVIGALVGEVGVVDESGAGVVVSEVEGVVVAPGAEGIEVGLIGVAAGVADSAGFSTVGSVGLLSDGFSVVGIVGMEVGVDAGVIVEGAEVGTTGVKPGLAGVVLIDGIEGVSGFAIGVIEGVLVWFIVGVADSALEGFFADSAIVGTAYPAKTAAATPKAAICFRLLTLDLRNLLKGLNLLSYSGRTWTIHTADI